MVMNNSLKTVCDKHNINFSSAKNVIQIFKKEGRLEKKVVRSRKNKKKAGSQNDPDLSHLEDPKDNTPMAEEQSDKRPTCALMLRLEEDDSLVLVPR